MSYLGQPGMGMSMPYGSQYGAPYSGGMGGYPGMMGGGYPGMMGGNPYAGGMGGYPPGGMGGSFFPGVTGVPQIGNPALNPGFGQQGLVGGVGPGQQGNVNNSINYMLQAARIAQNSADYGMKGSVQNAYLSAFNNMNSVDGMVKQAQIATVDNSVNIANALAELGQRAVQNISTQVVSQWMFTEAIREKMFNMFADLDKQRIDNAFARAKGSIQLMKY